MPSYGIAIAVSPGSFFRRTDFAALNIAEYDIGYEAVDSLPNKDNNPVCMAVVALDSSRRMASCPPRQTSNSRQLERKQVTLLHDFYIIQTAFLLAPRFSRLQLVATTPGPGGTWYCFMSCTYWRLALNGLYSKLAVLNRAINLCTEMCPC